MPELPEVETIRRQFEHTLVGRKITKVIVNNPKVIRQPSPAEFVGGVEGRSITGALRKGKLLVIGLTGVKSLCVHLKMTGQFVYPGTGTGSRVGFRFSDGTILDFNDNRLFAELRLVDDCNSLPFVRELGPDPFDISEKQFEDMLFRKGTRIKPLLMDQKFIAGIGNLYAAEMLFAARISPGRSAKSLSPDEKARLYKAMRDILEDAIKLKGSSVDNYVQLTGDQGGYVPRLKVYGRQGKPCMGCEGTVQRTTLGGRGTYFCPSCQK
ncbi:MAG: bifunctional DNA-formamidopyrimidine glycosylase/DNA-(apurinic or apyrimidinic site) lyase [Deltaproteobacteria bacterium]